MKKLLIVLLLGVAWVGTSEAAGPTRGAKGVTAVNFTTTGSSVSVSGAAVVYSVILSTGTAGTDYTALFDSASLGVLAATSVGAATLKAKINVSSTTQNTIVNFDPPLQFNNGIIAANSSAANTSFIVWEKGRVTQGY